MFPSCFRYIHPLSIWLIAYMLNRYVPDTGGWNFPERIKKLSFFWLSNVRSCQTGVIYSQKKSTIVPDWGLFSWVQVFTGGQMPKNGISRQIEQSEHMSSTLHWRGQWGQPFFTALNNLWSHEEISRYIKPHHVHIGSLVAYFFFHHLFSCFLDQKYMVTLCVEL